MKSIQRFRSILVPSVLLVASFLRAQSTSSLRTTSTEIKFEALSSGPRVISLRAPNQSAWTSTQPATLISEAYIDMQPVPLKWVFNQPASKTDATSVTYVYDSASPKLRLTWQWSVRAARGPIEHVIRIQNLESREIWIPLQSSFSFDWKISSAESLEHMYVEKGADTPSPIGTHIVAAPDGYSWIGTSSTYAYPQPELDREVIPFFLIQHTAGDHSGFYMGIEFSGRTHLTLARKGNSLHGEIGLNPDPGPYRTRLSPGATFETPQVFVGATSGGPDTMANVLRPWIREVLGNPAAWSDVRYPLTVNNSWGGGMTVNDEIARRMIRDSAELGLEMFHVDAGWFRGVGDWYPNVQKFPNGLVPIAEEAHAHGLKLGLWVDWTQAGLDNNPGALNVRNPQIRDWLTLEVPENWKPEEFKGLTIDIGAPAAKAWAERETDRIVTDYKLDMLEHDGYLVAQGCDATDHPHAAPEPLNRCVYRDTGSVFVRSSNSTDVSYHAVRAYYDIQSSLRAKHPGLLLEVCNDGGRMVDFGSASHADYFSITDTYDPLSNRRAFYDTSYLLPAAMLETYVERWPAPQIDNFRYMLRSGMMGWLSIMIDTTTWNSEQHDAAKEEIRLYKTELRPLIREANLYHISQRPDGVRWDGMQYFDAQRKRGAVYAFRGSTSSETEHLFLLKGLNPDSSYHLRFHDHSSPDRVATGSELMNTGLHVKRPMPNSSEIILMEEVTAGTGKGRSRHSA